MLRGLLASAVKITPIKIFWKTVPPWVLITLYGYCLCLLSGIVFVGVSVEISLILSIVTFLLLLNLWNQVEIFYAIRFQHLVLSTSSNPCFISFTVQLYIYSNFPIHILLYRSDNSSQVHVASFLESYLPTRKATALCLCKTSGHRPFTFVE